MNEVIKFLTENKVLYLATIGIDGKPKVRPWGFMMEVENKLYFCTSNKKTVYKELENNPYIELSCTSQKFEWIRISGKVNFDNNFDYKKRIIEENPLIRSLFKTADNPDMEIFYLSQATAVLSDYSDNPPKEYNL